MYKLTYWVNNRLIETTLTHAPKSGMSVEKAMPIRDNTQTRKI